MSFKSYFKGRNSGILWLNVLIMIVLLIGIPILAFTSLSWLTHHGEKIEVPDVHAMSLERAKQVLESRGFEVVVTDSLDTKDVRPGAVYEQNPKAGTEVKSGRIIYLVTRYLNEALIEIPDLVGKHSYREAKVTLTELGFRFTPDSLVDEQEKGYLLGIYQGNKMLHRGDKVSKSTPLTLYVGSGIRHEEVETDTIMEEEEVDPNFADE